MFGRDVVQSILVRMAAGRQGKHEQGGRGAQTACWPIRRASIGRWFLSTVPLLFLLIHERQWAQTATHRVNSATPNRLAHWPYQLERCSCRPKTRRCQTRCRERHATMLGLCTQLLRIHADRLSGPRTSTLRRGQAHSRSCSAGSKRPRQG